VLISAGSEPYVRSPGLRDVVGGPLTNQVQRTGWGERLDKEPLTPAASSASTTLWPQCVATLRREGPGTALGKDLGAVGEADTEAKRAILLGHSRVAMNEWGKGLSRWIQAAEEDQAQGEAGRERDDPAYEHCHFFASGQYFGEGNRDTQGVFGGAPPWFTPWLGRGWPLR
jgi:hypothetical protein